jgi:NTE family protein
MSVPKIGDYQYVDGALVSVVPLSQAILRGADEIDVIILHKEYPEIGNIELIRNPIHLIVKCEELTYNTIKKHNLNLGMLADVAQKDVRINFHYTERKLTNNSLIFSSTQMTKWWGEGYEYAKADKCKSYILSGATNTYRLIDKYNEY